MSVIEDTRKVLQDFLAPEMRELKARLDALDKGMDASEKRADERHAEIAKRADERHAETIDAIRAIDMRMDRRVDSILDFSTMKERLAVLEAERQARQKVAS